MRKAPGVRAAEAGLALASGVIFLALVESGLRALGYGPDPPLPGPMYVRSASRGYDLKPGYSGAGERSPYLVHPPIAINALGLRGREVTRSKPAGVYRILCLGDSYVFGWGLEEADAAPARLESLLDPRLLGGRRPQVLNAGVPAYGTAQELDQLLDRGLALRPDLVVLGFVLNDALPGGDSRPRLELPFKRVLRRSALYRLMGRVYQQGLIRALAESSERHKVQDVLACERGVTETLESGQPESEEARRRVVGLIDRMSIASRRHGAGFVVVLFPNRWQIEEPGYRRALFNDRLVAELGSRGIPALDLFGAFKKEGVGARLFLADTHPNAAGHDLAARALASWFAREGGAREGGVREATW